MGQRYRLAALAALCAISCGDTGAPDRVDAGRPIDAAPVPPADAALGVACLGADCTADQVCCRELLMPGAPAHYCVPEAASCAGTPFSCDGPEDCAGDEQCCSTGTGVECLPTGTCPEVVVCHQAADCPSGPCCDTPFGVVRACSGGC